MFGSVQPSDSVSKASMLAAITTGMLASGQTLPQVRPRTLHQHQRHKCQSRASASPRCLLLQDTPLTSPDGAYQLIMQSDGNVVL